MFRFAPASAVFITFQMKYIYFLLIKHQSWY